ncbi:MAG: DUF5667 domain-containing protein [Candidatus Hadarchaeales archaeon]
MFGMETRGIATVAVIIAVVATVGGTATPVVVDTIDVDPDSPFYGLERIGEGMKEAVIGGQGFDIALAEERVKEFEVMNERGKSAAHLGLVDEAEDRMASAVKKYGDERGLGKAENAVKLHLAVLENVREKVPEQAKVALSLAISRSSKSTLILAELKAGKLAKEDVEKLIDAVKENVEKMEEEVKTLPVTLAVQAIEKKTVEDLLDDLKDVSDPDPYLDVIEMTGKKLMKTVELVKDIADKNENVQRGLEIAKEAVSKHLVVLENVYARVPDAAKPAIALAITYSAKVTEVISAVEAGVVPATELGEKVDEAEEEIEKIREEIEENLKTQLPVEVAMNVNVAVVERLSEKIQQQPEEAKLLVQSVVVKIPNIARDVRSAEALQKAIDVSQKCLTAIENIPENLKIELQSPISYLQTHLSTLENLKEESSSITDWEKKMESEIEWPAVSPTSTAVISPKYPTAT